MRIIPTAKLIIILIICLLVSCVHPISKETRRQLDPKTTFAMVSDNPAAFLDQKILLGGVVIEVENTDNGSELEIMEWRLSRWGEPTYPDQTGRRFLVKTSATLDPTRYEPGTLVTLAGVVLGKETRNLGEQKYDYPLFDLTEIHLWESPYRYGIHGHIDPSYPYYVEQNEDPNSHPYDSGYTSYPYTPYWYRNPDQ